MRKIIMWTWPSLYDSNNTFSRDQSFFINSKEWQTARTQSQNCERGCMEYLWCLCVLQAMMTKAVKQTYITMCRFLSKQVHRSSLLLSTWMRAAPYRKSLEKKASIRSKLELPKVIFGPEIIITWLRLQDDLVFSYFLNTKELKKSHSTCRKETRDIVIQCRWNNQVLHSSKELISWCENTIKAFKILLEAAVINIFKSTIDWIKSVI